MVELFLATVDLNAYVNSFLIIGLMGVGALIKHLKLATKIENRLIPVILTLLSIVFCVFCAEGNAMVDIANAVISGLINAMVAVGLHQLGKNIFLQKKLDVTLPTLEEVVEEIKEKTEQDENKVEE